MSHLFLAHRTEGEYADRIVVGCRDIAGDEGILYPNGIEFGLYHTWKTICKLPVASQKTKLTSRSF